MISGLQNSLEIDTTTVEKDLNLAKFQVKDPSGDNVSCMINDSNVATEMFYLQLDDIGMIKNNRKKKRAVTNYFVNVHNRYITLCSRPVDVPVTLCKCTLEVH